MCSKNGVASIRQLIDLSKKELLKLDSETDIFKSQENINKLLQSGSRYIFRYSGIIKKSQIHRISNIVYKQIAVGEDVLLRSLDFYTSDDFGEYYIGAMIFRGSTGTSISLEMRFNEKVTEVETIKDLLSAYCYKCY
jgi:hypothetical protein